MKNKKINKNNNFKYKVVELVLLGISLALSFFVFVFMKLESAKIIADVGIGELTGSKTLYQMIFEEDHFSIAALTSFILSIVVSVILLVVVIINIFTLRAKESYQINKNNKVINKNSKKDIYKNLTILLETVCGICSLISGIVFLLIPSFIGSRWEISSGCVLCSVFSFIIAGITLITGFKKLS